MSDLDLKGINPPSPTTWTLEYPAIYGAYAWLNQRPVHYFTTNLSIRDLHNHVRLMNQIPGVERWGFEALFQRLLSSERVDQIVDGYLRQPTRFKFFPPVTLALLPAHEATLLPAYPSDRFAAERRESFLTWELPGLRLRFHCPDGTGPRSHGQIALISWDAAAYHAVAIDGQHRIAALKQFRGPDDPASTISDVPATILVFDPAYPPGKTLIHLTREIFVDVNRNARVVDESRIILLDDRDLVRKAARSCILQTFDGGPDPIALAYSKLAPDLELELLPGIPQELIDVTLGKQGADVNRLRPWQYLSVFNLYRIIKFFLFEDHWPQFEETMGTLDLREEDGPLGAAIASRRAELADDDNDDGPAFLEEDAFAFSPQIVQGLTDDFFAPNVRPLLTGVFTGFTPYRRFLETALASFATPEGPQLRELLIAENSYTRGQRSPLAERLATADPDLFAQLEVLQRQIVRPAGWATDLSWYGVTQRALFYQAGMTRKAIEFFLPEDAPRSATHFVDAYVGALNKLWDSGLFEKLYQVGQIPLWYGSALDLRDGHYVVRPSDAAARRMGHLLRILVAAWFARARGLDATQFYESATTGNLAGLRAAVTTVKKCFQKFLRNMDALGGERVRKLEYYEPSAERRLRNVVRRAVFEGPEEREVEEPQLI